MVIQVLFSYDASYGYKPEHVSVADATARI